MVVLRGSCPGAGEITVPQMPLSSSPQRHSYLLWEVFIARKAGNGLSPLGPYTVVAMRTWKEDKEKRNVLFRKWMGILHMLKPVIPDSLYCVGFRVSLSWCHVLCWPWSHISFRNFSYILFRKKYEKSCFTIRSLQLYKAMDVFTNLIMAII